MPEDREPTAILRDPAYGRQYGESRQAYRAFVHYRDLGADRTLDGAYRAARERPGSDLKVSGKWSEWCARWRWVERAAQWDAHLDAEERKAYEAAARAEGERLAERRREQRATELDLGAQLIEKARQMLTLPVLEVTTERDSDTGKVTQTIKPGKWTMRDVARFVEVGSQLRRLALDMDTSRAAVRVDIEDEVRQIARQHGWDEDAAVRAANEFADGRGDRATA